MGRRSYVSLDLFQMKTCSKCGKTKALDAFHARRGASDGRRSACKACRSTTAARYYEENGESVRAYAARYRKANLDKVKAACARWRETNPEKTRAYDARYRKEKPEKGKEQNARYRKKHSEKIKAYGALYRNGRREHLQVYQASYREENRERLRSEGRRRGADAVATLKDYYVRTRIAQAARVKSHRIPQELVEAKRTCLIVERQLKEFKKCSNSNRQSSQSA